MVETTIEEIQENKKDHAIRFANWLYNNFFIPVGTDGNWEIDSSHSEFNGDLPEVNLFSTEQLYEKFTNKKGEY